MQSYCVSGLSEWEIPGFRDGQDWEVSEGVSGLRVDSRLRGNDGLMAEMKREMAMRFSVAAGWDRLGRLRYCC